MWRLAPTRPGPCLRRRPPLVDKFHEPTPGFALFDSPDGDMSEPHSLGTYYVKTDELHQYCGRCGRRGNFLDVVKTALDGGALSGKGCGDDGTSALPSGPRLAMARTIAVWPGGVL